MQQKEDRIDSEDSLTGLLDEENVSYLAKDMGNIRHHELEDRVDPSTLSKHCVSLVSSGCGDNKELSKIWLSEKGTFDVSMLDGIEDIYWRGCLDKYDRFANQKEWRVCWLPSELNYEAKILHVGSLEDIIDIVPTKDIRRYLLKKYSGYVPEIITNNRRTVDGTESYGAFKGRMRDIDGTGEFVGEIG